MMVLQMMKTLERILCLAFVALVGLGCSAESESPPASESPSVDATSSPASVLIPPFQGTYDDMWRGLRTLDSVVQPVTSESAKRLLAINENDGSEPAASMNPQPMIINLGTPEELSLWIVTYTDANLIAPDTCSIVRPPREALLDALYNEHVRGLAFNPYTKVSQREVFNFNIDKLYIAGLVGYLTTEDAEPGRRCEAANSAHAANELFESLHHALRAIDEREEWSECEMAKLSAMWELDFPGSRSMAHEELEWFIAKGNDTAATRAMLAEFQQAVH